MVEPNIQLSVIVPTHNHGQQLLQAVGSVFSASLPTFEIIVVDDASTDHSISQLAQAYAFQVITAQLRIYKRPHRGLNVARNYGLKKAAGRYVMFVDATDYLLPDVDLMADLLTATADILVYSQYLTPATGNKQRLLLSDLGLSTPVVFAAQPSSKCYRRQFLIRHAFEFASGLSRDADVVFNYQVLLAAQHIQCLPRGIYASRAQPVRYERQSAPGQATLRLIRAMAPLLTASPRLWQRFVLYQYLELMKRLAQSSLNRREVAHILARIQRQLVKLQPVSRPRPPLPGLLVPERWVLRWCWRFPKLSRWVWPLLKRCWRARRSAESRVL